MTNRELNDDDMLCIVALNVKRNLFSFKKFVQISTVAETKDEKNVKLFLIQKAGLNDDLVHRRWSAIRTCVVKTLRSKRGSVTIDMKNEIFSEKTNQKGAAEFVPCFVLTSPSFPPLQV